MSKQKIAWEPNPGPQAFAFYECRDIFEVLYGGAKSGGKSAYLLGDFLSHAAEYLWRAEGVIFRKTYPQLDELVKQGKKFYSKTGLATYKKGDNLFEFHNGATLKLRHIDRIEDCENYQGHEFCVGGGTPVLMANGEWKAIEDIKVGEYVSTLNGSQEVTHTHDMGIKDCVSMEATVFGAMFRQVQSHSHSCLSTEGEDYREYLSRDKPKRLDASWNSYKSLLVRHLKKMGYEYKGVSDGYCIATNKDGAGFRSKLPELYLATMLPTNKFYGLPKNDSDGIFIDYDHPYTKEKRRTIADCDFSYSKLSPIGKRRVFDITVSQQNHYITPISISKNSWMGNDEITNFKDFRMFDILRTCARSPHAGVTPVIRYTANPGGRLHNEVKAYFVDPAPLGRKIITNKAGESRIFVPARITDNMIMMQNDPGYIKKLQAIEDPELRKAWLDGSWDVSLGSFFGDIWQLGKHVVRHIRPSEIPAHWNRYRAFDWGSAKPFACLWYTVARDDVKIGGRYFPNGSIIFYREYYGCVKGMMDTGLKMTAVEVAREIKKIERVAGEERIMNPGPADNAIWTVDGGPSIADMMYHEGVTFIKSDKSRATGWEQMRIRLKGYDAPLMYFDEGCTHSVRTIPFLARDEKNFEDLDTHGEDHICVPAHTKVLTSKGYKRIDSVTVGDMVATRFGYREALRCWETKTKAELWEIQTTKGTIQTTAGHKLYCLEGGFTPVSKIKVGMELLHITPQMSEKLLSVTEYALTDTRSQEKTQSEITTYLKETIESVASGDCTNISASGIMAPCQLGAVFTTLTETHSTTKGIISNSLIKVTTPDTTWQKGKLEGKSLSLATRQERRPPNGTGHQKGELGTQNMQKNQGSQGSSSSASVAEIPMLGKKGMVNSAEETARPLAVVEAIRLVKEKEPVWNMTINEVHEYFSEGFLSMNCDVVRYVCMHYQIEPLTADKAYLYGKDPDDETDSEVLDPNYG